VNNIARLSTTGANDATFNIGGTIGVGSTVRAVEIDAVGDIYIGGAFTTARGVTRNYMARLNSDGSLDTDFPHSELFTNGVNIPTVEVSLQERLGCA
jgi:hypothetical protein